VNSIGDPVCRPAFRAALTAYLTANASRLCDECQARVERNPLRVLDCKRPDCQPVIEKAPSILDALCGPCREHFARVRSYLDGLGLAYEVTPRLVRGLDYYVRTTFEVLAGDLGAQNAVAGGGRYDGLIERLEGPSDPGIGFAIGMERVALLLGPAANPAAPFVQLVPLGEAALVECLRLGQALRGVGVPVEVGYGGRKLRGELERAHRLHTPHVVILGEDELRSRAATLRDMTSGEQEAVPLDRLTARLEALYADRRAGSARPPG
jgi:histidyl-tRNA synthetase